MARSFEYVCKAGHVTTASIGADEDPYMPRLCEVPECRELAHQVWLTAPGMHGFESRSATADRMIYARHNITHETTSPNGEIQAKPNNPDQQCQCGHCGSHRRRNAVTEEASAKKGVFIG